MSKPTCYLAGPMTGHFEYNFPVFVRYADLLRRAGVEVISPAELDIAAGIDPRGKDPALFAKSFTEAKLRKVIRRDVAAILQLRPKAGDFIAVMNGWTKSRGSGAEVYVGAWAKLPIRQIVSINDKQVQLIGIHLPLPHAFVVDGGPVMVYDVQPEAQ